MWKLNNTLNNQWVKGEIKREIRIISKPVEMEIQHIKSCGMQQKQLRGKFIAISTYIKNLEKSQKKHQSKSTSTP